MLETKIYDVLKEDHRLVADLLTKIVESGEGQKADRREWFNRVYKELNAHSEAEEKVFYSALKEYDEARELIMEADQEHHVVAELMREINELKDEGEIFIAKVTVLKENVEHHVKEEESEIFDTAKKILETSTEAQMAKEFKTEKNALK